MKKLIPAIFLLLVSLVGLAQNVITERDVVIHLSGSDAWVDHNYSIDIYKKGNSVKIVYAYTDSIKWSEIKVDPDYRRVHPYLVKYDSDYPKRQLIWDTIGMVFKKHTAYTRDSITLNLKKDTAYKALLQKIATATKQDIVPDKPRGILDGNIMLLTIITPKDKRELSAVGAELTTHPLLTNFAINTIDRGNNSRAVLKIRKYYVEFDRASYLK